MEKIAMKYMKSILLIIGLMLLMGTASATSTYDVPTNTITVGGTLNNLSSIASDISNGSAFSWNEPTKTAITNAHIFIESPSTTALYINDSIFKFNGAYVLENQAKLYIHNSTITSINSSSGMRGSIDNTRRWGSSTTFIITNSSLSHLGDTALNGIGTELVYGNQVPKIPYLIDNNDFNDVQRIVIYDNSTNAFVTNNTFYNVSNNLGIECNGYFANNIIYNYSYNYVFLSMVPGGRDPIIINNVWHNCTGVILRLKQGSGGAYVANNTIRDCDGTGIMDMGSLRTVWNIIENNTITNCTGDYGGFYTAGDYTEVEEGRSVSTRFENNTITDCNNGIYINDVSNFVGVSCIIDAYMANNTITNSDSYGIYIKGDPYTNVTIINNNISGSGNADIYLSSTAGNTSPIMINNNYSTISIIAGILKDYKYLDTFVTDISSTPISDATVDITNTVDSGYPVINITGHNISSFTTGIDGHTPLPAGNESTSIAVLDFYNTSTTRIDMEYSITADAVGYGVNNSVTFIPDDTWLRLIPNIYQNTVSITLSGWSHNPDHTYTNVKYRWDTSGNKTIIGRDPLETDTDLGISFEVVVT